jgi:hypothetical protein
LLGCGGEIGFRILFGVFRMHEDRLRDRTMLEEVLSGSAARAIGEASA